MKIEKALFDDLPEIVALQKLAFYKVGVYYRNFRLRQLVATLAEFEQTYTEYLYLKATEGDRIVGSARAKDMRDGVYKIENVIVHPGHQRKGIGKRLVIEIMEQNPEANKYELYTGKYTPGNVKFYEGLGFTVVKEIAATGDTPLLVRMEKKRPGIE
jgi:ribosomal protein S18 acetylase RimI-like enzyme